jgi:ADP-ribose pyrophosphatase YjhB (NUDIX family)
MKRAVDLAYRMQKWLWKLFQPQTRGVKVLLFNGAGELMLIRNSYGRSDLFVLPGGGVRPWEAPEKAARREILEELGCLANALHAVSTHFSDAEGKRDTIHLFAAQADGTFRADNFEVEEAQFFPLDALPPNISGATLRRIEERTGKRIKDGTW